MFELCRWSKRIAKEIRDGSLVAKYTYAQFKEQLLKIPANTDFSRLATYHAAQTIAAAAAEEKEKETAKDSKKPNTTIKKSDPALRATKKQKMEDANDDEFAGVSKERLKQMCKSVGLSTSGGRDDLIARYRGPHPPKVWLTRKLKNQYVPSSYNVAGTSLLVGLYLHEKKTGGLDKGMTKDELYVQAEGLGITKNPFSGGTTQTGTYT
jgi:hypothetical protein